MNVRSYFQLALAKSFVDNGGSKFEYEPNQIECIGHGLRSLVGRALDLTLREIKNPVTIIALTLFAAMAVTIIFYPGVILSLFPFITVVKPWMIKGTLYAITQMTILGLGIRTYGRLSNNALMEKWNNDELTAILPGSRKV